MQTSAMEKVRSGLAGGVAILLLMLALQVLPHTALPLIIVSSMAASTTLLFAVPHSPLSQPWNLFGGHIIAALIGLACSALISSPALAAGSAVGLAILVMQFLRCLHPPSAATALLMVLVNSQFYTMEWQWALALVAINAGIMLLLALIINNLLPGRHYPVQAPSAPTPPKPAPFITLEQGDLAWAMKQMESAIDVSEEDLATIYRLALESAQKRIDGAMPT